LFAAAKRLDERNYKVAKETGQEKPDSGKQNACAVPGGAASGSSGDPWTAALRVALEPANLCQVLQSEKVEEVQLSSLPVINRATADQLRGLSINNTHHRKH